MTLFTTDLPIDYHISMNGILRMLMSSNQDIFFIVYACICVCVWVGVYMHAYIISQKTF